MKMMRSLMTILCIFVLAFAAIAMSPLSPVTSSDTDFENWSYQSTGTQDDARNRLFAVTDSFITNTGQTEWLLEHIQATDPDGVAAFVAHNCPE